MSVEDNFGNAIELQWSGARLDRVLYGGRCSGSSGYVCDTSNGVDHFIEVEFVYSTLTSGVSLDYSQGFEDARDGQLYNVSVSTAENASSAFEERLRYVLSYKDELEVGGVLDRVTAEAFPASGFGTAWVERTLATFEYVPWDGPRKTVQPPVLNAGRPPALSSTGTMAASYEFSPFASVVRTWDRLEDLTGDGLPDSVGGSAFLPLERTQGSTSACGDGSPCPLDYGASLISVADLQPPLTLTGYCGSSKTGRYAQILHADVNGDGLPDQIETAAIPRFLGGASPHQAGGCSWNQASGAFEWTVRFGVPGGLASPSTHSAPFRFPSIGSTYAITKPRSALDAQYAGVQVLAPDHGLRSNDGLVELMDMNGDGWLDVVQYDDVIVAVNVFLWENDATPGWSTEASEAWDIPEARGLNSYVAWNEVHTDDYNEEADYVVRRAIETYTISGFRDLNGDGLLSFGGSGEGR